MYSVIGLHDYYIIRSELASFAHSFTPCLALQSESERVTTIISAFIGEPVARSFFFLHKFVCDRVILAVPIINQH